MQDSISEEKVIPRSRALGGIPGEIKDVRGGVAADKGRDSSVA